MLNSPSELRELARRMESGHVFPPEKPKRLVLDYPDGCRECEKACDMKADIVDQLADGEPPGASDITDHEWLMCVGALRAVADQRDREINDARTLADLLG